MRTLENQKFLPCMTVSVEGKEYNYIYGPTWFKSLSLFRTSGSSRSGTLAWSLMSQNPWTRWEKTEYTQKQLILFVNFYWSIVYLQCCVNFYSTTKWFNYTHTHTHIYIYILLQILFIYGLSQDTEYSPLYYIVGSCLSVLHVMVCTC